MHRVPSLSLFAWPKLAHHPSALPQLDAVRNFDGFDVGEGHRCGISGQRRAQCGRRDPNNRAGNRGLDLDHLHADRRAVRPLKTPPEGTFPEGTFNGEK